MSLLESAEGNYASAATDVNTNGGFTKSVGASAERAIGLTRVEGTLPSVCPAPTVSCNTVDNPTMIPMVMQIDGNSFYFNMDVTNFGGNPSSTLPVHCSLQCNNAVSDTIDITLLGSADNILSSGPCFTQNTNQANCELYKEGTCGYNPSLGLCLA
ncbi:MAG: hypothetical protein JW789_02195 [Candidatus Aenigmarchaeota archaeon]|nr:hypothetical protein [Candidatus Aenigmarchaeota archaeon]